MITIPKEQWEALQKAKDTVTVPKAEVERLKNLRSGKTEKVLGTAVTPEQKKILAFQGRLWLVSAIVWIVAIIVLSEPYDVYALIGIPAFAWIGCGIYGHIKGVKFESNAEQSFDDDFVSYETHSHRHATYRE